MRARANHHPRSPFSHPPSLQARIIRHHSIGHEQIHSRSLCLTRISDFIFQRHSHRHVISRVFCSLCSRSSTMKRGSSQGSNPKSDQARPPNQFFKYLVFFMAVMSPWQIYDLYNYYQVGKRVVFGEKRLAEDADCMSSEKREIFEREKKWFIREAKQAEEVLKLFGRLKGTTG